MGKSSTPNFNVSRNTLPGAATVSQSPSVNINTSTHASGSQQQGQTSQTSQINQTVNTTSQVDNTVKEVGRDVKDFFFKCYMDFVEKGDMHYTSHNESRNINKKDKNYEISDWFDEDWCENTDKLNELMSLASFFVHLRDGEEFLIECYYANCCYTLHHEELVKAYHKFPAFVKVISNQDIIELIHNFDTLSDQQIEDYNGRYKIDHFTRMLTDQQLLRLMRINKEMKLYLHYENIIEQDNRYDIITTDKIEVFDDYYQYDTFKEEFRTYILEHDRVPDELLSTWLCDLSDDEIKMFPRNRLFQIMESGTITLDEKDDDYPTNVIEYLGPITNDDIIFMQKQQIWKIYNYFPTVTYELAKRFTHEKPKDHFLRLNTMLDVLLTCSCVSHYLKPIGDDIKCYITQDPFYRCQQYCKCCNDHPVSFNQLENMNKKTCGICRTAIGKTKFVNLSSDDFDCLFV